MHGWFSPPLTIISPHRPTGGDWSVLQAWRGGVAVAKWRETMLGRGVSWRMGVGWTGGGEAL